jgi:hypothetical protein
VIADVGDTGSLKPKSITTFVLKEPPAAYKAIFNGEMVCLRGNNGV